MIAKGHSSINLEDVYLKYTDADILYKYFGISCIPEIICSPIREDKHPSFSFFENNRNGKIMYKDFGTGETGNLYGLLSKIWNIPLSDVYIRILQEMDMICNLKRKKRKVVHKKSSGKIEVKIRKWRDYDLEYWKTYGISGKWLNFGEIYPISHIIKTKENTQYIFPVEKYAYVYVERKDNKVSFKIYQPYSTEYKWISKHDSSVWDLWTKIPERGDKLIITSSRKDALCLWENTGIPALSLQGEGYIPKEHVMQQLKDRFSNIYVLYDNDYTHEVNNGRKYGKTLSDKFNLIQIEIPEMYKSKDPSDLYKNHGKDILVKVIDNLILKTENHE